MRRIPDILIASIAMCALAGPAMAQSSGSSTQGKRCYDVEVQKPKEVKDEHKITGTPRNKPTSPSASADLVKT